METKPLEPLLAVGDFARNKIHGYITFLYRKDMGNVLCFDGLILNVEKMDTTQFSQYSVQVGFIRAELPIELEKVPATLSLVTAAKNFLDNLNSIHQYGNRLDNLSYVELLYKLNEKEKELKNENQL